MPNFHVLPRVNRHAALRGRGYPNAAAGKTNERRARTIPIGDRNNANIASASEGLAIPQNRIESMPPPRAVTAIESTVIYAAIRQKLGHILIVGRVPSSVASRRCQATAKTL